MTVSIESNHYTYIYWINICIVQRCNINRHAKWLCLPVCVWMARWNWMPNKHCNECCLAMRAVITSHYTICLIIACSNTLFIHVPFADCTIHVICTPTYCLITGIWRKCQVFCFANIGLLEGCGITSTQNGTTGECIIDIGIAKRLFYTAVYISIHS